MNNVFRKSPAHRLLLICGGSLIFSAPFALLLSDAVLIKGSPSTVLTIVAVSTLILVLLSIAEVRSPRLYTMIVWSIAIPSLLVMGLSLLITWYIEPTVMGLSLLSGAIAFIPSSRTRRRILVAWVLLTCPMLLYIAQHIQMIHLFLTIFTGAFASILLILLRYNLLFIFPKVLVFVFLVSVPSAMLNGFSYLGITPGMTTKVEAQPGVRTLFDYRDMKSPLIETIGPSTFWVVPECSADRYLVGTRITAALVGFSESEMGKIRRLSLSDGPPADMIEGVTDTIDFDCPEDRWYIGYRSNLLLFDPLSWSVLARARLPRHDVGSGMVNIIRRDRRHERVLCMVDMDRHVYFFDQYELQLREVLSIEADSLIDFRVDEVGNQLITSITGWRGSRLRFYDLDSLELIKEIRPGWVLSFVSIDAEGRRLFGPSTFTGDLFVVDLDDREVISKIPVEPGLRYSAYDGDRDLLYVGGYARGNLHIVDPEVGEVLWCYDLGHRVRSVYYNESSRTVTVTSSTGGFEIDPDVLEVIQKRTESTRSAGTS